MMRSSSARGEARRVLSLYARFHEAMHSLEHTHRNEQHG